MAAARLTEGQPCKGSNAAQLSAFEPMASQAQPHEHEAFDAGPDDYGHHDVGESPACGMTGTPKWPAG